MRSHDETARNPVLFAVGCPRSGTTLLQRMLDSHPQLAVTNDSHFITRAVEASGKCAVADAIRTGDMPLTPAIVEWVKDYKRTHRIGLSEDAVREAGAASTTYRGFVEALYEMVEMPLLAPPQG